MKYKIIPVGDRKVKVPETLKDLSEEGIVVNRVTTYWLNRKADGDVKIEEIKNPKAKEKGVK